MHLATYQSARQIFTACSDSIYPLAISWPWWMRSGYVRIESWWDSLEQITKYCTYAWPSSEKLHVYQSCNNVNGGSLSTPPTSECLIQLITETMIKEKCFLALAEYYTAISKWMKGDVCCCNSFIVLQSQIKEKSSIWSW